MCYPLLVSSVGIIVCLITTLFATDIFEIKAVKEIEPALKKQLIISTALMTVGIALISWLALPAKFTIFNFGEQKEVSNWGLFLCVAIGLWAGLIIGYVTEYYTSNAYRQEILQFIYRKKIIILCKMSPMPAELVPPPMSSSALLWDTNPS